MVETKQDRRLGRRPGRSIGLAVVYYLVAGLLALAAAATSVFTVVSAIGSGCQLFFSPTEASNGRGPLAPEETFSCQQHVDFVGPIVAIVVAVVMLATVRRLTRDPMRWGPLVGVGVVVGIAVAVLPLYFIVWVVNFYRYTATLLELAIGLGPLLWALPSGVIVWRQAARRAHLA